MPSKTIPLVGGETGRLNTQDTKDQRFSNCYPVVFKNPVTQSASVFLEKRGGFASQQTVSAGNYNNDLIYDFTMGRVSAFSADEVSTTDSTVYVSNTSVGVTSDCVRKMTSIKLGSISYAMISTLGTSCWFLASDSYSNTAYTADGNNSTTITDIKVSGVNSVAGLYVGQKLTAATNIVAGSRIVSIDPVAFTAVLDTATTGGAFNDLAITKEPIAKIVDTDFPTDVVSRFVELNGKVYCLTDSGRLYNSAINNPASWSANDYLTCNQSGDPGVALERIGDYIAAFGAASIELYRDVGNASGSPLSRVDGGGFQIGAYSQDAMTKVRGVLYWLSRGTDGTPSIYSMSVGTPVKISEFGSERRLPGASGSNRFDVSGYSYLGTTYIFICNRSGSIPIKTLCFSPDVGIFSEVDGDYFFNLVSDSTLTGSFTIYSASKSSSDGEVYSQSRTSYLDNGSAFTMTAQTSKLDFGTDVLITYTKVSLLGSDIQASGSATLEYSDDDYATWSTAGTFDLTQNQPKIDRVPAHRGGRAWRLTHSANTAFRAQALKFDFTVGRH